MNQYKTKRMQMLAEGAIGKTLFTLAVPAIAGMVVMAVYNVVDTYFVSLLRDTTAIAATGIVFPVFQLIGAVGLTFGMGAASVISRRLGEERQEEAAQTATTALYSALAAGILFSVTGMMFTRMILKLFGATDSIMEQAVLYGRIILGGSVFQVMNMTLNNMLRSEGAAVHSSTGQILGAVANIILDPVFIFGLNLGITGAAIATVISQCLSTCYLLSFYLRNKGALNPLDVTHLKLNAYTYGAIMTLGLPTFIRQVMSSISFGILNRAAGQFGDSAIAALSVSLRLFMLLLMALFGLAQGLQPLVGFNYGAGNIKRVMKAIGLVFAIVTGVGVVVGVSAFAFAPELMKVFAPQDGEVIAFGSFAIRALSLVLLPVGYVVMSGSTFQALGKGGPSLILAVSQQGGFLIPLVIVLPRFVGLNGVYLAQPSAFVLSFFVGAGLLVWVYKKVLKPKLTQSGD